LRSNGDKGVSVVRKRTREKQCGNDGGGGGAGEWSKI
jgi:hypothetical protein